jgi:dCTP deaminase
MPATTVETGANAEGRDGASWDRPGVFSSQSLRRALDKGWIHSDLDPREGRRLQAASLDLTLGAQAWRLRCSFLPDAESTVDAKLHDLAFDPIDLREGALLERNRPYLIPLAERLRLPGDVKGRTNPKSSTGRLDVFTRVITDGNSRFDEIKPGYDGTLYLEVVPRSFAIRVRSGLALNQLRLIAGDAALRDRDLREGPDEEFPLLYHNGAPIPRDELPLSNGLFLSLDLGYHEQRPVGFRAKSTSRPVDMSLLRHYDWREYWEPVVPERAGCFVLEPEQFYLLLSREGVCIPPTLAAEMAAYDPTAGELRTHYAGFFDPGFGYDPAGVKGGSRAALEVRAHDVPFMVEDGQAVCKLTFERLDRVPDSIYGEALTSHYQGQETMLSKHFADQTAGLGQPAGA